jgi:hypothetical protein
MKNSRSLPARNRKVLRARILRRPCGMAREFRYGGAGTALEVSLSTKGWGFKLDGIDGEGLLMVMVTWTSIVHSRWRRRLVVS